MKIIVSYETPGDVHEVQGLEMYAPPGLEGKSSGVKNPFGVQRTIVLVVLIAVVSVLHSTGPTGSVKSTSLRGCEVQFLYVEVALPFMEDRLFMEDCFERSGFESCSSIRARSDGLEYFCIEISQLKPSEINSKSPTQQRLRDLSFCTRYIHDLWNPLVDKVNLQQTKK